MQFDHPLHAKALSLSKEFKRVEADLIDVLIEIDRAKLFRQMGFSSLFEYVTKCLLLSESVAYALIVVSRKAAQIPDLKMAIESGELSVSRAKAVTSVLTKENAGEILEKAKTLSHRALEKEVAAINPKAATPETTKYVSRDRIDLRTGISEALMKKLRRIQNLESQRLSKTRSLEDVIEAMADLYLEAKDPVKRANRILHKPSARKVLHKDRETGTEQRPKVNRTAIPSQTKHLVFQRDRGQCTHIQSDGKRCASQRWIEIHHKRPLHANGDHSLENLTTLCFSHHRAQHTSGHQTVS